MIKWILPFIIQFVLINISWCQVSMSYLDSNFAATNSKSKAKYILTQNINNDTIYQNTVTLVKKDSVLFTKREKSKSGEYYHRVFSDKGLPQKAGWFSNNKETGIWFFYNILGRLYQTRDFKNGEENGIRKTYYDAGLLRSEETVSQDKVNGYFKNYYKNGKIEEEGKKKDGYREGTIKRYYKTGQLKSKSYYVLGSKEKYDSIFRNDTLIKVITYRFGRKHGKVYYFEKGKLVASDSYRDDELKKESDYEEPNYYTNQDNVFNKVEEMPLFKNSAKDITNLVQSHLFYPEVAILNEIEGKIYFRLAVDTAGSVYDIQLISVPLGYGCDEIAYDAVALMPDMIPGKQNGNVVPVYYNFPVTFKLF